MKYILILTLFYDAGSIHSVEFSNLESCSVASNKWNQACQATRHADSNTCMSFCVLK
jgi:hypothetical protein